MYVDNESNKLFDRMHERDLLRQEAHHLDDDHDTDFVSVHMIAEGQQGVLTNLFILAAVVTIGLVILLL